MPVYEYQCDGCRQPFSKYLKSAGSAAPALCPVCGAATVRRLISRFQMHQTEKTKLENLDPRFEKELDWADRAQGRTSDPLSRMNLDFDPSA